MVNKQAVVFILDATLSMRDPFPAQASHDNSPGLPEASSNLETAASSSVSTRWSTAKETVLTMISQLMSWSKTHEVCVIVTRTPETQHHLQDKDEDSPPRKKKRVDEEEEHSREDPSEYDHLTELTNGVERPTVRVLRKLSAMSIATEEVQGGGVFQALELGAHALQARTARKKYTRKMILLTDAADKVVVDVFAQQELVDNLRDLECSLHVIGYDFDTTAAHSFPGPLSPDAVSILEREVHDKDEKENNDDSTRASTDGANSDNDDKSENEEMHDSNLTVYSKKPLRIKWLISLAERLGGQVIPTTTMQHLLEARDICKPVSVATKSKIDFKICPGLVLDNARQMLLMKKQTFPSMKKTSVKTIEENGESQVMKNGLGEEMTEPIDKQTFFVDPDDQEDMAIDSDALTKAIAYGVDYVPVNEFDVQGLKREFLQPKAQIEILCYAERASIPDVYLMGPPHAVSGDTSQRSCAAISALAQALQRLDKVAICTFLKKRDSDPILGALLPMENGSDENGRHPIHLVFLQLPFAGDVKRLDMPSFQQELGRLDDSKRKVTDTLIDSLMLPDDDNKFERQPDPHMMAFRQTLMHRALEPEPTEVVRVRSKNDYLATPAELVGRAVPAVDSFYETFPLKRKTAALSAGETKILGRKGKKVLYYKAFLTNVQV